MKFSFDFSSNIRFLFNSVALKGFNMLHCIVKFYGIYDARLCDFFLHNIGFQNKRGG